MLITLFILIFSFFALVIFFGVSLQVLTDPVIGPVVALIVLGFLIYKMVTNYYDQKIREQALFDKMLLQAQKNQQVSITRVETSRLWLFKSNADTFLRVPGIGLTYEKRGTR